MLLLGVNVLPGLEQEDDTRYTFVFWSANEPGIRVASRRYLSWFYERHVRMPVGYCHPALPLSHNLLIEAMRFLIRYQEREGWMYTADMSGQQLVLGASLAVFRLLCGGDPIFPGLDSVEKLSNDIDRLIEVRVKDEPRFEHVVERLCSERGIPYVHPGKATDRVSDLVVDACATVRSELDNAFDHWLEYKG